MNRILIILVLLLSACTTPGSGGPVQGPQNPVCVNRDGTPKIERTTGYAPYSPDLGDCGRWAGER